MRKSTNMILLILAVFVISMSNVNAQETYYTNQYGISLTKEEYDFFSKMYFVGYQEYITQDVLDQYKHCDMDASKVEKVEYEDKGSMLASTYYETSAKKLTIAKATGMLKTVAITLQWKGTPRIKSFDLIGAYFNGVSLLGTPVTLINYTNGTIYPSETKYTSNGFGSSLKIPSDGKNIVASTTFQVNGSGRVNGSYQHARSSLALSSSQSFDTRSNGLGNVFYFDKDYIRSKYDGMGGVSINI